MELQQLIDDGGAPEWMTDEGYRVLRGGYLLPNETPRDMYMRVASAAASYFGDGDVWRDKYFDAMWKNWLCPASPVLSNMGTTRGLPISCNSIHVGDSVDSIFKKVHELAMLSKNGAGVGIYLGDIRGRGALISGNGRSEGVIPWSKVYDSTIVSVSQGSTRRGAGALYIPIDHADVEEFINIRRPTGDVNRRCLNMNHGICISDEWLQSAMDGDTEKRKLWQDVLRTRVETGEPYMFFVDNVNNANPACYKKRGLTVKTSNICTEITLYTDPDHSFVCCLSSLNLARWHEWKDTDLPAVGVRFLDAVMQEYIERSEGISGLEASRLSAIKGRALGLGVLGWHTLLQDNMHPFDSMQAMLLNSRIFRTIRQGADAMTHELARERGEPEWCTGDGRRNTHTIAIAPTVSNSTISGGVSAGIEPIAANVYVVKSATGTFIRTSPALQRVLVAHGQDNRDVWTSMLENAGSVQHFTFLSQQEKDVFLTAREINQHAIVRQAAQRTQYVDQSQSVNLFFAQNSSPRYIHDVHLSAWQSGLKSLYYLRTEGVLRSDLASRNKDECAACEG